MALSNVTLMALCQHLAQSLKIWVFGNLHLHYDSYMYFTSMLRLPVFSAVTNMAYNRVASKNATGLSPKILTRTISYCDQMDH